MASFDQRTVTVTRHEYVLKSPAHGDEIGKAFSAASQDMARCTDRATDVWVEARDEDVVVVWTESKAN